MILIDPETKVFQMMGMRADRFTKLATIVSALWFLGMWPALIWTKPSFFDDVFFNNANKGQALPCDFPQYYMGAAAIMNGKPDSLYPKINREAYARKSTLSPKFRNPWHDESANPVYFHKPAMYPEMSRVDEGLLETVPGLDRYFRYIYPPPLALLLTPLALCDLETAALCVWPTIAAICLFGTSFFSSRIHRWLLGRPSYTEGIVVLAIMIFSFRGRTDLVYSGNATPILSFLITFCAYAWLRGWLATFGFVMIPLLLFKSIGLAWLPMLLFPRIRWKTLGALAVSTVALNSIMLSLGGRGVYETFFTEILPHLNIPAGAGISRHLLDWFGIYPAGLFVSISVFLVVWLTFACFKAGKDLPDDSIRRNGLAVLAGSMAVFCLLNFAVWLPYFPNYLLFPFLGWILFEARGETVKWRLAALAGTAAGFAVCSTEWIAKAALHRVAGTQSANLYHDYVLVPCFVFIMPLLFLVVSFRSLARQRPEAATDEIRHPRLA